MNLRISRLTTMHSMFQSDRKRHWAVPLRPLPACTPDILCAGLPVRSPVRRRLAWVEKEGSAPSGVIHIRTWCGQFEADFRRTIFKPLISLVEPRGVEPLTS